MKTVTLKLRGVAPLMMHNARLADPTDPIAREKNKIAKGKNKTPEVLLQIKEIEWRGGPSNEPAPIINIPKLGDPPLGWRAHYMGDATSASGISDHDDETGEAMGWPLGGVILHKSSLTRGTPDSILWFSQQGQRRQAVRGTHTAQEVEHAFCWLAAEVTRRLLLP